MCFLGLCAAVLPFFFPPRLEVEKLEAALAATQHGLGFNNRVPQPLNHRVVSSMCGPKPIKWLYAADGDTAASAAVQAETWGGLCATGKEQSPIDVASADAALGGLESGPGGQLWFLHHVLLARTCT